MPYNNANVEEAVLALLVYSTPTLLRAQGLRFAYPVVTHAGTALLAQVDGILSRCDALVDRANALAGFGETRVVVVMEDACPYDAVMPVLSRFATEFPAVQVDILQPLGTSLVETVLAGDAVLGLGYTQSDYPAGVGFRRQVAESLASGKLVELALEAYPFTQ